ncbi:MAG: TIGR03619 family F420-dependent LLM class oxidoreductase [Acidobacteria bacterium]|nr:TIGR03619 family F420-dependent LLM class oxidoreductase [Acidobacteriota bacterium]
MKFGIIFVNAGPFALPENIVHLAQTAEQVGIESIWTAEHVVMPVGYKAQYPYNESGRMPVPENIAISDPLVFLAYVAAVTQTLRLATGVLILPQRHPTYVAKEIATLDVLSGGRAILGVGIGWMHDEFEALGIPFNERAARTEESIQAIRSLWKDKPEAFEGRFFQWEPVESNPKPVQQPGVPIVVGGDVEATARRAARLGDGFFPARSELEHLRSLLAALSDECGKIGRNPDEIQITTGMPNLDLDTVRRYQDMGVSRLMIAPPGFDRDAVRKRLERFGDNIISKL